MKLQRRMKMDGLSNGAQSISGHKTWINVSFNHDGKNGINPFTELCTMGAQRGGG